MVWVLGFAFVILPRGRILFIVLLIEILSSFDSWVLEFWVVESSPTFVVS